ncbi:hypothetical protein DFH07DRAFT_936145 [Mycena maculata]|uniref:Uncharacterized protein n=1 Tax=Mycena maculata TaxID=230809 RepID=A0AAD7NYK0_9AGAR|nr:hypothetical protein DFH07DRAFT_936145 [Mycena maculata]
MSVTRRLSARRGSTTAPDPYAKNAHLNRESSSILTIVRVTSPPVATPTTPAGPLEAPPSPRRAHRRIGSNPNSPVPTPGLSDPPAPGRLSFAFSSFGGSHQQPNPTPGSPRIRPASPIRVTSAQSFSKPRLSPEQLLDVAKQATNPRYVPASPSVTSSAPSHSPARSSSPQGLHSPTVAPATFTPLPPDVYLPFLDRPTEVSALLSSPPSAKLFALLAQTFPKNFAPRENDALPINTAEWTFADLKHWLMETTRDEASDAFWVQTARRCILLHSELIWERLKGALGVPPELDVEYTEAEYNDVFEDDDESDEILEDGGMKSVGHWDGWDAVMDSPVFGRKSAGASPNTPRRTSAVVSPLSRTSSSTPTIVTQLPTPVDDAYFTISPGAMSPSASGIIIEPVLASAESAAANPPPLSLPASLSAEATGLGDIGEEDEEDESSTPNKNTPSEVPDEPQLHGLRISTPAAPALPSPGIRSATTGAPLRSPSFSAREPTFARSGSSGSLHRSGSFGSVHSVGSGYASEDPYDPVADRSPGNPLFPSNFARLAVGPTLAANNPALRSPTLPPQSKYGFRRSSSTRSTDRGNRFRRSWGHGDDYAVTVASSSSAGGSVRDAGAADDASLN